MNYALEVEPRKRRRTRPQIVWVSSDADIVPAINEAVCVFEYRKWTARDIWAGGQYKINAQFDSHRIGSSLGGTVACD